MESRALARSRRNWGSCRSMRWSRFSRAFLCLVSESFRSSEWSEANLAWSRMFVDLAPYPPPTLKLLPHLPPPSPSSSPLDLRIVTGPQSSSRASIADHPPNDSPTSLFLAQAFPAAQ